MARPCWGRDRVWAMAHNGARGGRARCSKRRRRQATLSRLIDALAPAGIRFTGNPTLEALKH
ncbi:hypothetical protein ACMDCT_05070 [Halomonadaceae bacterium KBTZ08]